jgi:hypothetical protein
VYLLVFHAYIKEIHGSKRKIANQNLVRQSCAEGFNYGVKGLTEKQYGNLFKLCHCAECSGWLCIAVIALIEYVPVGKCNWFVFGYGVGAEGWGNEQAVLISSLNQETKRTVLLMWTQNRVKKLVFCKYALRFRKDESKIVRQRRRCEVFLPTNS